MKRIVSVLATACLLLPLAACGDEEEVKDEVIAALRATKDLSYRFQYEDDRPEIFALDGPKPAQKVGVSGIVEDDFRFKARVDFNGNDGFDEVVSDDTLAMRFIDPSRLSNYVNKEKVEEENKPTELAGITSLEVLQSRRWVVDSAAAPAIAAGSSSDKQLGTDPVLDAVTVLAYVERAVGQAASVQRFDPESITPAYSSSEDTFPKPERNSGVTRYDLRRPKLPAPGGQLQTSESAFPGTQHFRRMAIYVKDGKVVQVREATDARGKFARDLVRFVRTALRETKAPQQVRDRFDQQVERVPEKDLGALLVTFLNVGLQQNGQDPILQRSMRVAFTDLGSELEVDMPDTDVVKGSLGFLVVSERGKGTEESGTSEGAGGGGSGGGTATEPAASPAP